MMVLRFAQKSVDRINVDGVGPHGESMSVWGGFECRCDVVPGHRADRRWTANWLGHLGPVSQGLPLNLGDWKGRSRKDGRFSMHADLEMFRRAAVGKRLVLQAQTLDSEPMAPVSFSIGQKGLELRIQRSGKRSPRSRSPRRR